MISLYATVFQMAISLTLWWPCKYFAQKLAFPEQNMSFPQVVRDYIHIRKFSTLMNHTFGNFVTCYLLNTSVYYAVAFYGISHWSAVVTRMFYLGGAVIILVISADVTKQVQSMKEWLSYNTNVDLIPQDMLQVMWQELETNQVAIRGSNVYPVTYSLVSNVGNTCIYLFPSYIIYQITKYFHALLYRWLETLSCFS